MFLSVRFGLSINLGAKLSFLKTSGGDGHLKGQCTWWVSWLSLIRKRILLCPNNYKSYHSLFQYPHANNCKQVANNLILHYQLLLAKGNTRSFSQPLTKFSWSAVGRFGKCGMWWLWQTFKSWAFAGVQGIAEESKEMGKWSEQLIHCLRTNMVRAVNHMKLACPLVLQGSQLRGSECNYHRVSPCTGRGIQFLVDSILV